VRNGLLPHVNKCCVRVDANGWGESGRADVSGVNCVVGINGVASSRARAQSVGDAWRDCGDALAPGRVSARERGKRRRRGQRERPWRSTGVAGSDAIQWWSSMMAGWRAWRRGRSGAVVQ
jgi:hypothetical protein